MKENEDTGIFINIYIYNNCKILHSSKYKMFHPGQCLVSLSSVSKDKAIRVRKTQIGAAVGQSWTQFEEIERVEHTSKDYFTSDLHC